MMSAQLKQGTAVAPLTRPNGRCSAVGLPLHASCHEGVYNLAVRFVNKEAYFPHNLLIFAPCISLSLEKSCWLGYTVLLC